jgi:hypothetical protein
MLEEDAITYLKDSFSFKISSIKTISTTEADIKRIMCVRSKNSSGCNAIRRKILKTCLSVISHSFSYICDHSLYTGIFSNCLKISVLNLLYKVKVAKPAWKTVIPFE